MELLTAAIHAHCETFFFVLLCISLSFKSRNMHDNPLEIEEETERQRPSESKTIFV